MRTFRCLECKHEFSVEELPPILKCPKCLSHYVELVSGEPLKGKPYGGKSYSVK
ncbi:MAG: hydrogenase maturation nickel metallochaperone HypA [Synergistales bacterium]|nr:hydrogenase maturation nickel metallochaperone HypA [Synergistales bacterium]